MCHELMLVIPLTNDTAVNPSQCCTQCQIHSTLYSSDNNTDTFSYQRLKEYGRTKRGRTTSTVPPDHYQSSVTTAPIQSKKYMYIIENWEKIANVFTVGLLMVSLATKLNTATIYSFSKWYQSLFQSSH